MKPMIHARSSAKKYGGHPEDYLAIHDFMDSTKASLADVRHRAILHSSFGCFIVEKVFGAELTNSDGKKFSPRDVAEDHCIEDLGRVPSMESWLRNMRIEQWMGGPCNKNEKEKRKAQEGCITDTPEFLQFKHAHNPPKDKKKSYEQFAEDIGATPQEAKAAIKWTTAELETLPHVMRAKKLCEPQQYASYWIRRRPLPLSGYLECPYRLEKRYFPGGEVSWDVLMYLTEEHADDIVAANIGVNFW